MVSGHVRHACRGKVYLEDIPLDEARRRFDEALDADARSAPCQAEQVALRRGAGAGDRRARSGRPSRRRTTTAPRWTAWPCGPTRRWAPPKPSPIRLALRRAGDWVDTGDPLPAGHNAVIMVEHIQQHRRRGGRDHGRRCRRGSTSARWARTSSRPSWCCRRVKSCGPVDLGAVAACGNTTVAVRRKPRVAIMPDRHRAGRSRAPDVKPGDIIEFNSLMLAGRSPSGAASRPAQPITPTIVRDAASAALEAAGTA